MSYHPHRTGDGLFEGARDFPFGLGPLLAGCVTLSRSLCLFLAFWFLICVAGWLSQGSPLCLHRLWDCMQSCACPHCLPSGNCRVCTFLFWEKAGRQSRWGIKARWGLVEILLSQGPRWPPFLPHAPPHVSLSQVEVRLDQTQ